MPKIEKPSLIYLALMKIADKLNNISPTPTQTQQKFRVYKTSAQNGTTTWSKILFNIKSFDPNNLFDIGANSRFTAQEAGFYQINAKVYFGPAITATGFAFIGIYKNGVDIKMYGNGELPPERYATPMIADTIYLNKDDYLEAWCLCSVTNQPIVVGEGTHFSMHKLSD